MQTNEPTTNAARDAGQVDAHIIDCHDPGIRTRARIELNIARRLLRTLSDAGYSLAVDDGGEGESDWITGDENVLIESIFSVDSAQVIATSATGLRGVVLLIHGNGYSLISDYTVNLMPELEALEVWTSQHEDKGTLCEEGETLRVPVFGRAFRIPCPPSDFAIVAAFVETIIPTAEGAQ